MDIQEYLTNPTFDREEIIAAMVNAINGDLEHNCMGRSASALLQRALKIAGEANLDVKVLNSLAV